MASAWGGQVNHGSYNYWYGGVNAYVESYTDTTATIVVQARFQSRYAISSSKFYAYTSCGGQWGENQSTVNSPNSYYEATLREQRFTVARPEGTSGTNYWCVGRVRNTGSYTPGTSEAGVNVYVEPRVYRQPHQPKNFTATRVSDAQMDLTWQGDYTGINDYYPWTGVYVDRRVDDGAWSNVATLNWDSVNYSDKTASANHKYEYRVSSYGPGGMSAYSTAPALYTTPAAPKSVTLTKTTGTEVSVAVDTSTAPYATAFDVQESLNGGEWADVGTFDSFPQTVDVGGGTAKLRVRSKRDSLLSGWTESSTITTIVAPNAPTLTSKPDAVVATGTALVIGWTPNHPDGSEQSSAQVGYIVDSGGETVDDISGATATYTLPGTVSASACTVKIRVRTKGIAEDWGAWSSYYTFKVAVPPEAHFTTPGIDGAKIGDLPLTVEWEVTDSTGVAAQTLQLLDDSGKVLHTANPATDSREYELGAGTYQLSNATSYRLRLTVRGGSSLTVTTERTFAMSFAEPSRPSASVTLDESKMAQTVTVQAGPTTSDEADVLQVEATPGTLVPGFEVYGATRQNLWANPSYESSTINGITYSNNSNGTMTFSGTATAKSTIRSERKYILKPGTQYTVQVDRKLADTYVQVNADGACFFVGCYTSEGDYIRDVIFGYGTLLRVTFTTPSNLGCCAFNINISQGVTVSGTYRVMLREATEDEIASAQQTASTLQEGGTADLPQDYPVTLPTEPVGFDWCKPGINGAEPTAIVVSVSEGAEDGTTTPIDMQGQALYAVGNARDVLHVDGTGAKSIEQNCVLDVLDGSENWESVQNAQYGDYFAIKDTGNYTSARSALCDSLPVSNPYATSGSCIYAFGVESGRAEIRMRVAGVEGVEAIKSWLSGNPVTLIYEAYEPKTVEIGSISMPEFPADPTTVYAVSDIPATVSIAYPDTDSLSVTRVLADGSRWLVADGLLTGQQAIDPLPPLNADYTYEVTANTGAGAAVTVPVEARIESRGRMALNFGQAAATAHVMGANASVSYDDEADGELYHFADGGESGGLPQWYPTGDIDASGSVSFELMDRSERDRMKRSARLYSVGWFRDAMGGRIRARMRFGESIDAGGIAVWKESVDMDELVFEEAW